MKKTTKTLCLILALMMCISTAAVYAEDIASGIIELINPTEIINPEDELQPMMASGCCYQYWVPDTWNLQYMDQTMAQIAQSNGWSLGPIKMNESNERTQILYGASGQTIGSYHIDHKSGGRITQSHYHLDGDSTRIHYVVYR